MAILGLEICAAAFMAALFVSPQTLLQDVFIRFIPDLFVMLALDLRIDVLGHGDAGVSHACLRILGGAGGA